jgi:hypothetical protein
MAYRYMIHVFCKECSESHPSGVVIYRDEEISPAQSIAEVFEGRELPAEIVIVTGNQFQCPKTGKFFLQRDYRQVFLVRMI